MGVLRSSPRLTSALAAAITAAATLGACARVVPPSALPEPTASFGCHVHRGTGRGPVLALTLPEDPDGVLRCAIARDGQELAVFALADLASLPAVIEIGDASATPGGDHTYQCALWDDRRPVAVTTTDLRVPHSLPVAPAPETEARDGAVHIGWSLTAAAEQADLTVTTTVLRRDLSDDRGFVAISPRLMGSDWLDDDVVAGEVYAYALQHHARLTPNGAVWETDVGPARYVGVE